MANTEKLSDQLRDALRNADCSVYAVGKATGIDQSTLSRFLSGERCVSWAVADKLGEFLRLEIRQKKGPSKRLGT